MIHARLLHLTLAALLVGLLPGPLLSAVEAQTGTVKMEWLGWSFFRFTSPTGKVILTNPFITGNADAAVKRGQAR